MCCFHANNLDYNLIYCQLAMNYFPRSQKATHVGLHDKSMFWDIPILCNMGMIMAENIIISTLASSALAAFPIRIFRTEFCH